MKSTFKNKKMHPNPSSSKLFFTPTPPNDSVIKIFDSTGRTILSKPFSQEINISGIEEGVLYCKILPIIDYCLMKH
ncbi:MAG: T9SS type A sorting domain-containing protein [Bacteroidetes bacterium]|nr:T9SS type A sorting domain-containing protein [Bacteroidota bacterium]